MSMPLPSERLSSLSCWELGSPLPRARNLQLQVVRPLSASLLSCLLLGNNSLCDSLERGFTIHVMLSVHASLWALSKIHVVVRSHIKCFAFFLKSCTLGVTRCGFVPFLRWSGPGFALGPLCLCITVILTWTGCCYQGSVETVPALSSCRASGSPGWQART